MARPLILRILGDPSSGVAAVKKQQAALNELQATTQKVSVAAQRSVAAQTAAAAKRDARLREEIQLFKEAAAAAVHGSKEQIAAANLAARAEKKLAASIGVTAAESEKLTTSHRKAGRELTSGARGALAGSGAFRALGRSLAFASGGFLVFATASKLLRDSVDAARQAAVTEKQLSAQFRASGISLAQYRDRIEEATQSVSKLAGFEDDELMKAFTTAFRGSNNVGAALRIQAAAADVARARNIPLASAALALTKGYTGQATALRRLGVLVPAHTKGMALLAYVQQRFAGQARAGTTAQERFHAALFQTEEVAGKALLPTLNRLTGKLADWLSKSKNQLEVQRQLKQIVSGVGAVLGPAAKAIEDITKALGGWRNAIITLASVWAAFKVKAIADSVMIGAANVLAAGITASAWKAALISTGFGALAVAAGLAAAYVITHWEKVKKWFAEFGIWMERWALKFVSVLAHIPGGKGSLSAMARRAKTGLQNDANDFGFFGSQDPNRGGGGDFGTPKGAAAVVDAATVAKVARPETIRHKLAVLDVSLAKAMLTTTTLDERAILVQQRAIYRQLALHATNLKQRKEYWLQVGSLQSQIDQIDADIAQKQKDAADKALAARKKAFAAEKRHQLDLLANQKQALETAKRADEARLAMFKREQTALKQRIKNITTAFQSAVSSALSSIGALGQGPVLAPSDAARKAALGVGLPSAAGLVADIRLQNAQALTNQRNITSILALVGGTKGKGKAAAAQRHLQTNVGVDIRDLTPEQIAALAASPSEARQFIAGVAERHKVAGQIARVEMRAQFVTLHAARINLGRIRGQIAAETKVINHIKVEINGVQIRQRHVRSKTISQTSGASPGKT